MTKEEFKDTLAKYQDIINDIADKGIRYTDNKFEHSISKCKDNCYIALYDHDLYCATFAEWSDDGTVIIYTNSYKWKEYIPVHIFDTTEELGFWLTHDYIDDGHHRWKLSTDVIVKYRK